jgi:ABC-type spermidine/putrescine transport system permease subunit I
MGTIHCFEGGSWPMIITILYYLLTAYIAFLIIWNLVRRKKWQEEILYIIILMPFLLRLLRLK